MLSYASTIGTGLIWNLFLLICILSFFRKICHVVVFLLSPVFFMGALLYAVLLMLPDFNVPVDENTARITARHWLDARGIEGDISNVIVRKGADAGDIGYYVLKIGKPYDSFLLVPADARFGSDAFFWEKARRATSIITRGVFLGVTCLAIYNMCLSPTVLIRLNFKIVPG